MRKKTLIAIVIIVLISVVVGIAKINSVTEPSYLVIYSGSDEIRREMLLSMFDKWDILYKIEGGDSILLAVSHENRSKIKLARESDDMFSDQYVTPF